MKAKEYVCEWVDKKHGGGKDLDGWTPDEVMEFADDFAQQQIKALEDKAREIVETYILTTPTDKESGATMVVSKLAHPIIEMNELLNKN